MRVLTPQFYSDVVVAKSPAAYVSGCSALPEGRRTICVVSDTDCLKAMIDTLNKFSEEQIWTTNEDRRGIPFRLGWALLRLLRGYKTYPLDSFVYHNIELRKAEDYIQAVTSLLISRWLCFGVPEILDCLTMILNATLIWYGSAMFLDNVVELSQIGFVRDYLSCLLNCWTLGRVWKTGKQYFVRTTGWNLLPNLSCYLGAS